MLLGGVSVKDGILRNENVLPLLSICRISFIGHVYIPSLSVVMQIWTWCTKRWSFVSAVSVTWILSFSFVCFRWVFASPWLDAETVSWRQCNRPQMILHSRCLMMNDDRSEGLKAVSCLLHRLDLNESNNYDTSKTRNDFSTCHLVLNCGCLRRCCLGWHLDLRQENGDNFITRNFVVYTLLNYY
jgi:hypothetical protein